MGADRGAQCRGNIELSLFVSNNTQHEKNSITCIIISSIVRGAGLTSVMSCAAADVMSKPADCTVGCMRGASDSRLNGDS